MAQPETGRIVVVDLEATCWHDNDPDKRDGEITEIGICIANLQTNTIERPNSYIVRPEYLNISDFCTELTGHTKESIIKNGRPLYERLNTIADEYPLSSCVWGSWGFYDRNQIRNECYLKSILHNPFNGEHINIKLLHAMLEGQKRGSGMGKALKGYNMDFIGRPHSGVDDSINCARLLIKMFRGVVV